MFAESFDSPQSHGSRFLNSIPWVWWGYETCVEGFHISGELPSESYAKHYFKKGGFYR